MSLLFVCLGNICRSPTAEGVMRALVRDAGLAERIELDSAGTGSWHVGEPPDARATEAARRRGIGLEGAARQVRCGDFAEFDLILAMDRSNLRDLQHLAPDEDARARVRLLREFDPAADGDLDVPDPYYGGPGGFDEVLDLVHAACAALLEQLLAETGMGAEGECLPASVETGMRAEGECLPASVETGMGADGEGPPASLDGERPPASAAGGETAPAR